MLFLTNLQTPLFMMEFVNLTKYLYMGVKI
jgi:hypothetical protein